MTFDYETLTRKVRAVGKTVGPDGIASMGLYAEFHAKEPYKDVKLERDIFYGPDERNRLDVFSAEHSGSRDERDVLIFLHGGGFALGDKRLPGTPYNDNVALWAMAHGLVGINMTYRLTPKHKWPSGIEDIAAAVDWTRKNIKSRGGDPDRIFLFGVSAGAMHVGMYLSHSHLVAGPPIAGAVLESGIYDLTKEKLGNVVGEPVASYMGTDQVKLAERSSLDALVNTKTPILYVISEFDPPFIEQSNLLLMNDFSKRHGYWPNIVRLMGHNHFTGHASLNTPDDYFGRQILAFIGTVPRV